MKTYYFSILARNAKRRLEVRRCVAIEASHYDLAELQLIEQHHYLWCGAEWQFTLVEITETHYEAMCGILEVAA